MSPENACVPRRRRLDARVDESGRGEPRLVLARRSAAAALAPDPRGRKRATGDATVTRRRGREAHQRARHDIRGPVLVVHDPGRRDVARVRSRGTRRRRAGTIASRGAKPPATTPRREKAPSPSHLSRLSAVRAEGASASPRGSSSSVGSEAEGASLRPASHPAPTTAAAKRVIPANAMAACPDGNESDASSVSAAAARHSARSPTAPGSVAARYAANRALLAPTSWNSASAAA